MSIAPAQTQWYRCGSRLGELTIGVDAGVDKLQRMQGSGLLLQQALLLSEVELTLQAFELWQNIDLDLVPVEEQLGEIELTGHELELVITHRSLPEYLPTRFRFNKQALPDMAMVDEQLEQSLQLDWSPLSVRVILDEFDLQERELKKIAAGSTVLLPASFNSPWQGAMNVTGINDLIYTMLLDPTKKQATLYPLHDQPGVDPRSQARVQLRDELSVSPVVVLGDVTGRSVALSSSSAALAASVYVDDNPIAEGAVGEVGRGYAVHVSHLLTEE